MRKDKTEEVGYLVLVIAVVFFLIIGISKMHGEKVRRENQTINVE